MTIYPALAKNRFASLARAVNPSAGIKSEFSPLLHNVGTILGSKKTSFKMKVFTGFMILFHVQLASPTYLNFVYV